MLRLGVIGLLVAVTFAQVYNTRESVYKPGREYLYKYESQVITGFSSVANQGSGLKVLCDVRFQFTHNYKVVMQLDSVELYEVNENLGDLTYDQVIPRHLMTEVPKPQAEYLSQWLSEPIEFRYENGEISKLLALEEEPLVTVNIKKGILNLLSLDLIQRNPVERVSYKKEFRNFIGIERSPVGSVYRVFENSVVGECEAVYEVNERTGSSEAPTVEVSKVTNLNKCRKAPYMDIGLLSTLSEEQAEVTQTNKFVGDMNAAYKLNGDRRNYVIAECELSSKYILTPTGDANGHGVTYVRQYLALKDVSTFSDPIAIRYDEVSVQEESLQMEVPNPVPESSYKRGLPKSESQQRAIISKVYEILGRIQQARESNLEKVPELLEDLVLVLRELNSESIISVVKKVVEERQYIQKEILLDVIPTLTTPEVVPVVLEIIANNIVSSQRAQLILNMVALTVTPTPEVVRQIMPSSSIMNEEVVRRDPALYNTLLLTSGSLIHRLQQLARIAQHNENPEFRALFRQVVSEYRDAFFQAEYEEKIIILKAIGNSGLPEFLQFVEEVIKMENIPTDLRVLSVFALRRVPEIYRRKVQDVILPVFMDRRAPIQLRISSCVSLVNSDPSLDILRTMAYAANRDTNREFVAFVYRHFTSLAKAESFAPRSLKANLPRVIKLIRPTQPNYFRNTVYNYEAILSSFDMAVSSDVYLMNCKYSSIPEHIVQKIRTVYGIRNLTLLEYGASFEKLSKVVKEIFVLADLVDESSEHLSLDYIISIIRSKSLPTVVKRIMNVLSSLDAKELPSELRSASLSSYIKLFGNELRSINMPLESILELFSLKSLSEMSDIEMLKDLQQQLLRGYEVNMMKSLVVPQAIVTIPTPMGLPLNLNFTTINVASIKGTIRLNTPVSLWDAISGNLPEELIMNIDVTPRLASHTRGVMGIDASVIKAGAAIKMPVKFVAPIQVESKIYPRTMSIVSSVQMPQEKYEVMTLSIIPSTFMVNVPVSNGVVFVPSTAYCVTKVLDNSAIAKQDKVEYHAPVSMLGVNMKFGVSFSNPLTPYTTIYGQSCIWETELIYEPREDKPKSVEFELSYVGSEWSRRESYNYRTESRQPIADLSAFEEVEIDESLYSPESVKIVYGVSINKQRPVTIRGLTTFVYNSDLSIYQINQQVVAEGTSVMNGNAVVRLDNLASLSSYVHANTPIYKGSLRVLGSKVEMQTLLAKPDSELRRPNVPSWLQFIWEIIPGVQFNGEPIEHSEYSEKSYSREGRALEQYEESREIDSYRKEYRRDYESRRWGGSNEEREYKTYGWGNQEKSREYGSRKWSDLRGYMADSNVEIEASNDKYFITEIQVENVDPIVWNVLKEFDYYIRPSIAQYITWLPKSGVSESDQVIIKSRVSIESSEVMLLIKCPWAKPMMVELPLPSLVDQSLAVMEPRPQIDIQRMSGPEESGSKHHPASRCEKIRRTYHTEMTHKGRKQTCFSTKPVELCNEYECEPVDVSRQKVKLHCMDAGLESTQNYVHEANDGVVYGFDSKQVHSTIDIDVPKSCVARNI